MTRGEGGCQNCPFFSDVISECTLRTFVELLGAQGESFRNKWANELKVAQNKTFADIKQNFEVTVAKRELDFQKATLDAQKIYHGEMKKECENYKFLTTTTLEALHEKHSNDAVTLVSKDFKMSEEYMAQLKELLEDCFIKYKMEYTMYSSGPNKDVAIGIDLGTTNCCVAVLQNKEVKIITNLDGEETTPSYIAFNEDEHGIADIVIGQTAKDYAYSNPENTIFDAKRIIGRKINDEALQDDMKFWPFNVVEHNGVPKIEIRGEAHTPEYISSVLLSKLKAQVEEKIGKKVTKAVITVPAYFNDGQRLATKDAGEIAGFEVLTILNEPTAAAIAYKVKEYAEIAKKVLVFDLGGGTFDIALLDTDCDSVVVLGVGGDTHLGGEDFDKNLMQYCVEEFKKESGIDLFAEKDSSEKQSKDNARRTLRRLQTYCEKAKRALTSARQAKISVDNIVMGVDLHVTITRDKFEQLNMQLFQKTIDIVDDVLKSTKLVKDEINDLVLIGGSTKIPKVKQMLSEHFNNRALDHSINPDVAVAYGAAVQAALLNGAEGKQLFNFKSIQDVTPMSLGIEAIVDSVSGRFSTIITKNTKIPYNQSKTYYTSRDNQTTMRIMVYQGEEEFASKNKLLGEFTVDNIPPGKAGKQEVDVRMVINKMGILHVRAVCKSTNSSGEITVKENKGRLTELEKTTLKAKIAKPVIRPRLRKSLRKGRRN